MNTDSEHDVSREEAELDREMQQLMGTTERDPEAVPSGSAWDNLAGNARKEAKRRNRGKLVQVTWYAAAACAVFAVAVALQFGNQSTGSEPGVAGKSKLPTIEKWQEQEKIVQSTLEALDYMDEQLELDMLALELSELGFDDADARGILDDLGQDDVLGGYMAALDE